MSKPRIYLAGPMAGVVGWNHPAFKVAREHLEGLGFKVHDPTQHEPEGVADKYGLEEGKSVPAEARAEYLKGDFEAILKADEIVLLPGWETSTGANVELLFAYAVGIPAFRWVPEGLLIDRNADLPIPSAPAVVAHAMTVATSKWSRAGS
jgi:hypothetical protein